MGFQRPPDPCDIDWKVKPDGRSWGRDEAGARYDLTPEKLEMLDGRLLWSEESRLHLLGLLLENCGADAAVRFGDPEIWRQAVAGLGDPEADFRYAARCAYRMLETSLSYGDPDDGIRFLERWTTDDYEERTGTGDALNIRGRDSLLADLAGRRAQKREHFGDWGKSNIVAERVRVEGDTASVLSAVTVVRYRHENVGENRWKSLPPVSEVERWQETWHKTITGWRLRRRTLLEAWSEEFHPAGD